MSGLLHFKLFKFTMVAYYFNVLKVFSNKSDNSGSACYPNLTEESQLESKFNSTFSKLIKEINAQGTRVAEPDSDAFNHISTKYIDYWLRKNDNNATYCRAEVYEMSENVKKAYENPEMFMNYFINIERTAHFAVFTLRVANIINQNQKDKKYTYSTQFDVYGWKTMSRVAVAIMRYSFCRSNSQSQIESYNPSQYNKCAGQSIFYNINPDDIVMATANICMGFQTEIEKRKFCEKNEMFHRLNICSPEKRSTYLCNYATIYTILMLKPYPTKNQLENAIRMHIQTQIDLNKLDWLMTCSKPALFRRSLFVYDLLKECKEKNFSLTSEMQRAQKDSMFQNLLTSVHAVQTWIGDIFVGISLMVNFTFLTILACSTKRMAVPMLSLMFSLALCNLLFIIGTAIQLFHNHEIENLKTLCSGCPKLSHLYQPQKNPLAHIYERFRNHLERFGVFHALIEDCIVTVSQHCTIVMLVLMNYMYLHLFCNVFEKQQFKRIFIIQALAWIIPATFQGIVLLALTEAVNKGLKIGLVSEADFCPKGNETAYDALQSLLEQQMNYSAQSTNKQILTELITAALVFPTIFAFGTTILGLVIYVLSVFHIWKAWKKHEEMASCSKSAAFKSVFQIVTSITALFYSSLLFSTFVELAALIHGIEHGEDVKTTKETTNESTVLRISIAAIYGRILGFFFPIFGPIILMVKMRALRAALTSSWSRAHSSLKNFKNRLMSKTYRKQKQKKRAKRESSNMTGDHNDSLELK